MNLRLLVHNSLPASASPYRLVDDCGREVTWVNQFLDAQKLRQLSLRSLRVYAYDLHHLARWFKNTRHSFGSLNQSLLLELSVNVGFSDAFQDLEGSQDDTQEHKNDPCGLG
jgi:hypothetical protein